MEGFASGDEPWSHDSDEDEDTTDGSIDPILLVRKLFLPPHLVTKRLVDITLTFPTCYHVTHYDVSRT
jgi:hypothetical protein